MIDHDRLIDRKLKIGEQAGEEEKTPGSGVDEHRVFAKPAEPGEPAKLPLSQRCGIDDAPRRTSRHLLSQPGGERVDTGAEQVVIVVAPGISRHPAPSLLDRLGSVARRDGRVIGGEHDHAPRPRKERLRIAPQRFVPLEPGLHDAGKPAVEPRLENVVPRRGRRGRDPDPGKPQPGCLGAERAREVGGVSRAKRRQLAHQAETRGR